jgi:hypothetical protein
VAVKLLLLFTSPLLHHTVSGRLEARARRFGLETSCFSEAILFVFECGHRAEQSVIGRFGIVGGRAGSFLRFLLLGCQSILFAHLLWFRIVFRKAHFSL